MLAEQALNTNIRPHTTKETIADVLRQVGGHKSNYLPIVEPTTDKLVGQLHVDQIRAIEDTETRISALTLDEPVKVFRRQHIFEAIRLMLQHELKLIPVVDEQMTCVGIIQRQEALEMLAKVLNLSASGTIMTIELNYRDFTLSEVVHLIETEGAKILGLTVERPESEADSFKVSVKLNIRDASRVTSALRRYDYNVVTEEISRDLHGFDMENRADELLKYIDM